MQEINEAYDTIMTVSYTHLEFWEAHYLDDPELNAKILEGDVQLFMDSIELTPQGGITWWSEDMRDEFIARKGYDPMPYLFLVCLLYTSRCV